MGRAGASAGAPVAHVREIATRARTPLFSAWENLAAIITARLRRSRLSRLKFVSGRMCLARMARSRQTSWTLNTQGAALVHEFVAANPDCVGKYDALIARSKSVWEWPAGYLDTALKMLRITPQYILQAEAFEIRHDQKLVGFFACLNKSGRTLLDHLWIEPHHIGCGAGKSAVEHIAGLAKARGNSAVDVWPDPPAERFYLGLGFMTTREQVPSRISGGPTFRRLCLYLR